MQIARGRRGAVLALGFLVTLAAAGCSRGRRVEDGATGTPTPQRADPRTIGQGTSGLYEQMGLFAAEEPFPFVGSVAFLAGATPDSTLAVVSVSLPSRALAFAREGEGYRASYGVRLELRQGAALVRQVEAQPVVRVRSFRETTRSDESVLFHQVLAVPPGQYVLTMTLRDMSSARTGSEEQLIVIPRLGPGGVGSPLVVYEVTPRGRLDSLPALVASARSTLTFGVDTLANVYLESYGPGTEARLEARVVGEQNALLWSDTLTLARRGQLFSGVATLPLARVGVGITSLVVRRLDSGDSARTPLFVSFGEDLPVASFEQMLDYLRYFATRERLGALAAAPPEQRGAAWSAFLRETDPFPATPQHEALLDYFRRLQGAAERFREEGMAGWLTDRGKVYVTLGDPDQVYEQGGADVNQRGRVQVWEYREYSLQLTYVDQTGFGRWRLTSTSENDFEQVRRRIQTRR